MPVRLAEVIAKNAAGHLTAANRRSNPLRFRSPNFARCLTSLQDKQKPRNIPHRALVRSIRKSAASSMSGFLSQFFRSYPATFRHLRLEQSQGCRPFRVTGPGGTAAPLAGGNPRLLRIGYLRRLLHWLLPRLCATSWQRPADLRGSSRADGEQCSHALGGRTAAPRTTLLHRKSIAKAIETLNLVEFEQTDR